MLQAAAAILVVLTTSSFAAAAAAATVGCPYSAQVSCCFSASQPITSVSIGDVDYTAHVLGGNLSEPFSANTLTFNTSTAAAAAVFAFQGLGETADLLVQCSSSENADWADVSTLTASAWTAFGSAPAVPAAAASRLSSSGCSRNSNTTVGALQPGMVAVGAASWQLQTIVHNLRPCPLQPLEETAAAVAKKARSTRRPTKWPTSKPSRRPTGWPTRRPTRNPTTRQPTTLRPTRAPTSKPTKRPTTPPTSKPTKPPTSKPTRRATKPPTSAPIVVNNNNEDPATSSPTAASRDDSFKIEILFVGTASDQVKASFKAAAERWSEILGKTFANYATLSPGNYCGIRFASDYYVRDLVIVAQIIPIDGVYNVLGSAGPCLVDDMYRTRMGVMTFDLADVDWMSAEGTFDAVVLHEVGHVLGFGTMMEGATYGGREIPALVGRELLPGGGYEYLGKHGNQGNLEVGRTGSAIIEDTGGVGTARGHWKESVYDNELMTGYTEANGVRMPISRLTLQALKDLGYTNVDLSKADAYTAPGGGGRRLRDEKKKKIPFVGCGTKHHVTQIATFAKPGQEQLLAAQRQDYQAKKQQA